MADNCPLCAMPKETASIFCNLHKAAHDNLENAYASWSKANGGNPSKEEYFAKLEKLNETGNAVKSVIQHLRKGK